MHPPSLCNKQQSTQAQFLFEYIINAARQEEHDGFFSFSFFFFKENKPTGPVHISTKPDYDGFSAGVGIYNVLLIIICLIFAEY